MHVQLRVPVPGVVLEELGDHPPVGVGPSPRAPAVVTHPGVPGDVLEVVDRRPGARQHRLLHRPGVGVVGLRRPLVARLAGVAGRPLERHTQHRHTLGRGERRVDERHRLARRALRLLPQLRAALRPGVRLALQRRRVHLIRAAVVLVRRPEQPRLTPPGPRVRGRVPRVAQVRVDGLHQLGVDLTGQPQHPGTRAVPHPRGLTGRHRARVVPLPAAPDSTGQVPDVMAPAHAQHDAPPRPAARLTGPGTID